MYRISLKKSAKKELDSLPDQIFLKIDTAILSLRKEPLPYPHAKKLKGEDRCRLRVGDYRVVYSIDENQRVITISRIRHRRDVYR